MSVATRFIPTWSTVLAAATMHRLIKTKSRDARLQLLRRIFAVVIALNWRALPFVWHIELFGLVPLLRLRIRIFGLEKSLSIAQDPFETRIITKGAVTWDAADWNGHLSNSSYARACDRARFKWLLQVVGPALGVEKVWSPLAQTSFYFHREISMFAPYEIDVHIVAWDEKWIYYVCRFTTAPLPGKKERTLNCVSVCRSCFKMKGSRLTIPPARVLSISGIGPDKSNWERTLELRKRNRGRAWLKYGGELAAMKAGKLPATHELKGEPGWDQTGMECYEERRLKGLAIVERIGNVQGWESL